MSGATTSNRTVRAVHRSTPPNLKRGKSQHRKESIKAVREALSHNDPDVIAIGPNFVAEMLGGYVLGPKQVNPEGSVTSFYILQQEDQPQVLAEHPDRTEPRAVVSLAHPEGKGEFEKCMMLADSMGIRISKFIPFDIGDFTRYDRDRRRGGGIFELAHTRSSGVVAEFCARIKKLKDNKGFQGPFSMRNLGGFMWYPEPDIDPLSLVPDDNEVPSLELNLDRVKLDFAIDLLKLGEVIAYNGNRKITRRILEKAMEIGEVAAQVLEHCESSESSSEQLRLWID